MMLIVIFYNYRNMKKNEKRDLLRKFREISNIERSPRHTDRVFLNLNSYNNSANSSFNKDINGSRQDEGLNKMEHALSARKFQHSNQSSTLHIEDPDILQKVAQEQNRYALKFKKMGEYGNQSNNSMQRPRELKFSEEVLSTSRRHKFREDPAKYTTQTLTTLLDYPQKTLDTFRARCKQCEKLSKAKDQKIDNLQKQIKEMHLKLEQSEQKMESLRQGVLPYINNVNFLTVMVENLHEREKSTLVEVKEEEKNHHLLSQPIQLQQATKINKYLLKEGRQKEKLYYNQTYRLKSEIDALTDQNKRLKTIINTKDTRVQQIEEQIKQYENNSSMRERLEMCRQELYSYKLKYQEKSIENRGLVKKVEEMKYKLTILTSLIGCAIIFDMKQKENDKKCLKQFLNKIDKYENLTHNLLQNNGFYYLKFLQTLHKQESETMLEQTKAIQSHSFRTSILKGQRVSQNLMPKPFLCRRLYYPNYMCLLGEESISPRVEPIIVKPMLFIKIRSILDSKYIDYRLNETYASEFSDFCSSHLKNYQIQQAQKKIYFMTRQISQNQIKELNIDFLKSLMDERIQDLPQIEVFRDFLLGKYEEDEIYFYLMCRHKFMQGSELQNFINSGDPSKFIKFDKAKRLILKITQKFGRTIQNFICYHINQRKIIKSNQEFIRLYYLLKLLLLMYRKIRVKKIEEFRDIFENVMKNAAKNVISFQQFSEVIKKNFQFIARGEVCKMYKETLAVLQSQKSPCNFFECFFAIRGAKLFLKELIRSDKQLQFDCLNEEEMINFKNQSKIQKKGSLNQYRLSNSKINSMNQTTNTFSHYKDAQKANQLNELWPDSVYILGNENLNKQYVELLKSNHERIRSKLQTLSFLTNLGMGHLVKQNIHLKNSEEFSIILSDAIFNMIEFLNKIEKHKLETQNSINQASRKIGRFFKNKIYQFYHEMLQDINSITHKKPEKQHKRNKRYFKEKVRASKVFDSIKI